MYYGLKILVKYFNPNDDNHLRINEKITFFTARRYEFLVFVEEQSFTFGFKLSKVVQRK